MATHLGCIADDFTGATDLAGLLARSGVRVSLRLGVPAPAPSDPAAIEVIALKCRTSPVAEAVAGCRAALAWLRAAGASHFFWKYCSTFDSTPTGNIGPVADALLDDLGAAATVHCPAFPENDRFVFMGNLFVGDQPLAESPMRDHPLTPMRDSNLGRLLAPQVRRPVGLVDHRTVRQGQQALRKSLADRQQEGMGHLVVDALDDADLANIAGACRHMPLLCGGSALARPLPGLHDQDGTLAGGAAWPSLPPGALVLAGSCSAMTRTQVANYREQAPSLHLDPVALANDGPDAALAWLAAQPAEGNPLVYATAAPDAVRTAQDALGAQQAGTVVEDCLARLAAAAFERGIRRFVVAGGETAGAVTTALGIDRLEIGAEIAPGVPWTLAHRDGAPLLLALKSGNFGGPDFFTDALAAA